MLVSPQKVSRFLMVRTVVICVFMLGLAACASPTGTVTYMVMFGRDIGRAGYVSDREWNRFERQDIAPVLGGYTIVHGEGAYRLAVSGPGREDMILLLYVADGTEDNDRAIQTIAARYKEMFDQEAVLITKSPTTVIPQAMPDTVAAQ